MIRFIDWLNTRDGFKPEDRTAREAETITCMNLGMPRSKADAYIKKCNKCGVLTPSRGRRNEFGIGMCKLGCHDGYNVPISRRGTPGALEVHFPAYGMAGYGGERIPWGGRQDPRITGQDEPSNGPSGRGSGVVPPVATGSQFGSGNVPYSRRQHGGG